MINKLIGISGKICSGKSYLAKEISANLNIQVVSFGRYLYSYSMSKGLPTDRNSLQNLGECFISTDPEQFIYDVLHHAGKIDEVILIEGIRHKVIYAILKEMSEKSHFIYVDEEATTRFDRYISREKDTDDKISFEEFLIVDNHVVEQETESLKSLYDMTIKSTVSQAYLIKEIKEVINGD